MALVIQHAKHMRSIILSSVACPAITYFCIYFLNGKKSGGKNFDIFLFLSKTFKISYIVRRIQRDIIENIIINISHIFV